MRLFGSVAIALVVTVAGAAASNATIVPALAFPTVAPVPMRDDTTARWTHGYDVVAADAARTRAHDAFVGTPLDPPVFGVGAYVVAPPRNATRFVAGNAGPERFSAVYDPANRIAFYTEGCCAHDAAVLDGTLGPPPRPLAHRDLAGVRTKRGLALGDSAARVRAVWGAGTPQRVNGRTVYAYWSPIPARPTVVDGKTVMMYATCGQLLEAVVEHDRVVALVIGMEC